MYCYCYFLFSLPWWYWAQNGNNTETKSKPRLRNTREAPFEKYCLLYEHVLFTPTFIRVIWSNVWSVFSSLDLCIKPTISFAGIAGLCCDSGFLALLESICVISFALMGSIRLNSVHKDTPREAQRGHQNLSGETDGIHDALLPPLCFCAVARGSVFLWWVRQQNILN